MSGEAINLKRRLYVDPDGTVLPITNFFDPDGEECKPEDAFSFVAGEGDRWYALRMDDFGDPVQ